MLRLRNNYIKNCKIAIIAALNVMVAKAMNALNVPMKISDYPLILGGTANVKIVTMMQEQQSAKVT